MEILGSFALLAYLIGVFMGILIGTFFMLSIMLYKK